MMKKIISLCLMLLPLSVIAQNTDAIIRNIRSEYASIVTNKDKYEQVIIVVPPIELFPYDGEGDDPDLSRKITFYIENVEIKLISVLNTWGHWIYREEIIEYYLKNSHVFFVYQQLKDIYLRDTEWDERSTDVIEERFYYHSNECLKHLTKRVSGKLFEVEKLLQKTVNVEEDCINEDIHSKIHIYNEENIGTLFERYHKYEKELKSKRKY